MIYKTNSLQDAHKVAQFCRRFGKNAEVIVNTGSEFSQWMFTVTVS